MSSIASISTVLPEHSYTLPEIQAAGDIWLKDHPEQRGLFRRFLASAQVARRHFVLPVLDVISLNGLAKPAEYFEEFAPGLGAMAALEALRQAGVQAQDIGCLLFTSCTCPSIPSVDALILERARLPRTTTRIPIYQHGCAGGVVGLRLADMWSKHGKPVLLTSVELCSLVFQPEDFTGGHLVGSAIFGDGAASAVVTHEDRGLVFAGSQSYLLPDSRHLMGYDILDDGSHLRLDRDLPQSLARAAPGLVETFLRSHGLSRKDIPWWLFHPGGIKILSALDEIFQLEPEQGRFARETLQSVGNLSSASILFVLDTFLRSNVYQDGEHALVVGVGPGLTIELILFKYLA